MPWTQEVPDEIVEAATRAVSTHFYNCDSGGTWRDCENCVLIFDRAKRTIIAALPDITERSRLKPLVDFARWIISLDDPEGPGFDARKSVSMGQIIGKAREALALPEEF